MTHLSQLPLHTQSSINPNLIRKRNEDKEDNEAKQDDAARYPVQNSYISDSNADSDCCCSDPDSNEEDGDDDKLKHGSFGQ
ncbi:hypothetical protein A1F94_008072 [Pyrenophora tritici-repentis]|nr:hypothetical protein A1F94_008072 [Pyrenophora tritici-repentis]PWO23100.1 hypothetical protein PtrARCrB10_08386 [Pyrenophora tritici-repentis]PZC91845.1 hypothetical protein A1F95_08474 [Pyrenophora tritici-repentis]PZD36686.1 hypothetical protein A1F97_08255 [Pyrenophora tritici-repentis]